MANIAKFLNQSVVVRRSSPSAPGDFYGQPVLSAPETLPARKSIKQNEVRSAGGTEVIASTEVWLLNEIAIGDLVDNEPVQDRENVVGKDGSIVMWKCYL